MAGPSISAQQEGRRAKEQVGRARALLQCSVYARYALYARRRTNKLLQLAGVLLDARHLTTINE
eukprot:3040897-Prymnesium_polylepis.1